MMNLVRLSRWDPFRDLFSMHDRLNRFANDSLSPFSIAEGVGGWLPPVDVVEESDRLVFRAEIPGVDHEDIDIQVENSTLVLRGEKKHEKEVEGESTHRTERFYGTFSRSFALPTSVDTDKIKATYRNGVLEVVLPKADAAKPRKIKVLST